MRKSVAVAAAKQKFGVNRIGGSVDKSVGTLATRQIGNRKKRMSAENENERIVCHFSIPVHAKSISMSLGLPIGDQVVAWTKEAKRKRPTDRLMYVFLGSSIGSGSVLIGLRLQVLDTVKKTSAEKHDADEVRGD